MLIFRPNQGSSTGQYVNITLNIPVTTTITQAISDPEVVPYGQAVNTANLYANKANETFTTPINLLDPVDNTDAATRKFLFDTIFPVTQADITPTLNQYANKSGDTFTGPISQAPDPYNLNNAPTNPNTAVTNKFANDKLNQAASALTDANAVKTGQIYQMYTQTTPNGYLKCNGADIPKSSYGDLYNAIGDQYTPSFKESAGVPWHSQWGFNPSKQSDIVGWSQEASKLSSSISSSASLVAGNYIYIFAGYAGSARTTIQRASFDSNGNLTSAWTNVGDIPSAMYQMGYFATKNRIYLVGGYDSSKVLSTVYSAPIDATGIVGSFTTETSLPVALGSCSAFVIKNNVYVVGGTTDFPDTSAVNTVYKATIDSNGHIGSWTQLSNFPVATYSGRPILIKDRIYIIAAKLTGTAGSKVYYATYDSNGNIGAWNYVSDLPKVALFPAIACTDNYVFVISCSSNTTGGTASYAAPIFSDGSLGNWVQITDGPDLFYFAQSVIVGNKIYFIGGYNVVSGNVTVSNVVYSALFTSGITDYSIYINDQQNTNSTTFKVPNLPVTQNSAYYIKT
jgi:hypothetical protein